MRYWRILTLLLVVAVAGINLWRLGVDSFNWPPPPAANPAISFAVIVPAVFATAFAWLIGALLTGLLWPRRGEAALVLSLGAGLGLGVTALIFHFASLVSAQPLAIAFPVELLLSCVLLFLWLRKMRALPPPPTAPQPTRSWLGSLVRSVFAAGCGVAFFTLIVTWRAMPAEVCSQMVLSDLPLVPASLARSWAYTGSTAPLAAGLGTAAFGAATLGLLVAGVHRLRNRLIGLTGGLVLLGTPLFSRFTPIQHADVPLGFFLLAAIVLVSIARDEGDHGVLFLAGLAAGLAAWTKTEGLLFCGVLGALFVVTQLASGRPRNLLPLLGGLALALIPLAGFKFDRLGSFTDWSRHQVILKALGRDLPRFGEWYSLPFLVMVLHLISPGRGWLERRIVVTAGLLLLMLAACYTACLLGPANLEEYLASALARLLLQLWPAAIFLWCLLAVRAGAPPAGQTSPGKAPPGSPPSGQPA